MSDRRALQSVATQFWVNGVVFASFIPRLPEIRGRIDVDLGTLGLLLTLSSIGGLVGSSVCGPLIERFGTKHVMVGGGLGMILSLPVVGFAMAPVVFVLAVSAMQFFDVLTDVSMNMQGSWLSARRRLPVMNRLHGLWSLGTVVGSVAASILAATAVSLQAHLVGVSLVLALTMAFVAPGLLPTDETPAEPDTATASAGSWRIGPLATILAVLGAAAVITEVTTSDWAALRLTEDLGAGDGVAGLGFVAFTIGMVIGRFGGDWATARAGDHQLTLLASAVAGVGIAIATLTPSIPASLAGFLVAGLGVAVLFPRLYDAAAQAPGRPGVALGTMTAGMRIGTLGAPVLVGTLADTDGLTVGAAMAIVTLPCTAIVYILSSRVGATTHAQPT